MAGPRSVSELLGGSWSVHDSDLRVSGVAAAGAVLYVLGAGGLLFMVGQYRGSGSRALSDSCGAHGTVCM